MPHSGPERRKVRRLWAITQIAVMVAAIALVAIATERLHDETERDLEIISVQTCESVNRGRAATNEQSRLTREFLMTASKRIAEQGRTGPASERAEAQKYSAIYATLAKSYKEIPLADCRFPPVRPRE